MANELLQELWSTQLVDRMDETDGIGSAIGSILPDYSLEMFMPWSSGPELMKTTKWNRTHSERSPASAKKIIKMIKSDLFWLIVLWWRFLRQFEQFGDGH